MREERAHTSLHRAWTLRNHKWKDQDQPSQERKSSLILTWTSQSLDWSVFLWLKYHRQTWFRRDLHVKMKKQVALSQSSFNLFRLKVIETVGSYHSWYPLPLPELGLYFAFHFWMGHSSLHHLLCWLRNSLCRRLYDTETLRNVTEGQLNDDFQYFDCKWLESRYPSQETTFQSKTIDLGKNWRCFSFWARSRSLRGSKFS
jgi:hypothetical protein